MQAAFIITFLIISCIHQINCQDIAIDCMYGYYFYPPANTCQPCPYKCSACGDQVTCYFCLLNYYLNQSTKLCIACDPNCQTCFQYGCSKCNEGYIIDSYNNCVQISNPHHDNRTIIIASIVSAIVAILLIIGGVWYYKSKYVPEPILIDLHPSTQQVKVNQISTTVKNKCDVFANCQICFKNTCDLITSCNHYYHSQCLKQWSSKQRCCPQFRNIKLSIVNIWICLKCQNESVNLDIFDTNFLQNLENIRKDHKCQDKQQKISE